MAIMVVACQCGSSNSKARSFLKSAGYQDWLNISIYQGREKSLSALNRLPYTPEKEMLQSFLKGASKWVVIIGYDQNKMKWSDIAHNGQKSRIEAEFIVHNFGI